MITCLLAEGRPDDGSNNELALITGQVRRMLSQTAVKAQVSCLLSRIHQVGPGNKQIAKKRQWALQQDEKMRKERSAQWIRLGLKTQAPLREKFSPS